MNEFYMNEYYTALYNMYTLSYIQLILNYLEPDIVPTYIAQDKVTIYLVCIALYKQLTVTSTLLIC